ncbi:MAG: cation:proton antiporter [Deltaproteobacteria bacterium]|jgi:CPA1 family monovalent cation:H+ antiporter|nr:cation:proton antiporter [Deltaproteobacteria bacterium]
MESAHFVASLVATIVGLLLVASFTSTLAKRLHLPFTVMLVIAGMLLAILARHGPHFLHGIVQFTISPEVILFVFLPTLIYESAFNLDYRQLRQNIMPVLLLAVPGLLLSTCIIGFVIHYFTSIDFVAALLLGSILSATDPVAVISIFKQLGTPKRLTVLVEGESLFNDATSIVVSKILVGIIAAGYFSKATIASGIVDFFVVFLGGILVGCLAAIIIGLILGQIESDSFIEISLTTILAYFSFLIAEELFHVSGVMATVAAGVTMSSWGRTKISPSVAGYMENFWEYMAHLANALIFLLVGLRVELKALLTSFDLLLLVVVTMLISRELVLFILVPLSRSLAPQVEPVNRQYQTVMWWGGLRGAIALAIVLSLKDFAYADTFIALVMGAVLFTLLVQGLTIEKLVRWLGLNKLSPADKITRAEGLLTAKEHALKRIPELQQGGLFSQRVAGKMQKLCNEEIDLLRHTLKQLRHEAFDRDQERLLLFSKCLGEEKNFYYELFSKNHLSEQAMKDLWNSVDLQYDALRTGKPLPHFTLHSPTANPLKRAFAKFFSRMPVLRRISEHWRMIVIAREYEEAWGRYQGSTKILANIKKMFSLEAIPKDVINEIIEHYQYWRDSARQRIDRTAEQLPEFVNSMQLRLAGLLITQAQEEVITSETRSGFIPSGVAKTILKELFAKVYVLRERDLNPLQIDPAELLRKVPFFKDITADEITRVTEKLKPLTLPENEIVIRQNERGDTLYLISRGVIRVSHNVKGKEIDLATLIAGDFFGEMALLYHEPRTATCRTITPCVLYALKHEDFMEIQQTCSEIRKTLEEAAKKRTEELHKTMPDNKD